MAGLGKLTDRPIAANGFNMKDLIEALKIAIDNSVSSIILSHANAEEIITALEVSISFDEKLIAAEKRYESAESKLSRKMGVGNGSGDLFVYGDYEAIKAAQKIVVDCEELHRKFMQADMRRERAESKLADSENELRHVHNDFAYCQELNANLLIERDDLKSKLAELEKQEPAQWNRYDNDKFVETIYKDPTCISHKSITRYEPLYLQAKPAESVQDKKLSAPARVAARIFRVGDSESKVIEAAQRQFEANPPRIMQEDSLCFVNKGRDYREDEATISDAYFGGIPEPIDAKPKESAEPVAYADPKAFENFKNHDDTKGFGKEWMWAKHHTGLVPMYTHKPQRITEQDAREIITSHCNYLDGDNQPIPDFEWFAPDWQKTLRQLLAKLNEHLEPEDVQKIPSGICHEINGEIHGPLIELLDSVCGDNFLGKNKEEQLVENIRLIIESQTVTANKAKVPESVLNNLQKFLQKNNLCLACFDDGFLFYGWNKPGNRSAGLQKTAWSVNDALALLPPLKDGNK